MSRWAIAGLPC